MNTYALTAYEKNGEKILDEVITASNDSEAKQQGEARLAELNFHEKTHRLTSPKGQLLLFPSLMNSMETREKIMSEVIIREARYEDSYELSYLMGELGYPTAPEEMTERLETLLPNQDYACFVTCINDQVIGMIGLTKGIYFEKNGCYARISALVVSEEFRGNGIGKQLVRYGEEWAKEQGCTAILLNSGKQRTDTHEFYRSLDYDDTGLRFIKVIL